MSTEPTPTEPAAPLDPAQVAGDILANAAKAMPKPEKSAEAAPAGSAPPPAESAPATAPTGPIITDKAGTVFDPKRHKSNPDGSPFVNARGYFMPIGGRKPQTAAPASAGGPSASGTTVLPAPVADPAADAAAKTAWSEKDRAAANAATETAATADPAGKPAGTGAEPDRGSDAELSPEYGGELSARSLYLLTGAFTGDHKAAAATGAEHANLVKMFTAFLRYRGFTVKGWGALGLSVVAFLIDEKRRAIVWAKAVSVWHGWFPEKPKPERRAEPVAAPDVPPVPAPVVVMPDAGPTAPSGDWAERARTLSR